MKNKFDLPGLFKELVRWLLISYWFLLSVSVWLVVVVPATLIYPLKSGIMEAFSDADGFWGRVDRRFRNR